MLLIAFLFPITVLSTENFLLTLPIPLGNRIFTLKLPFQVDLTQVFDVDVPARLPTHQFVNSRVSHGTD